MRRRIYLSAVAAASLAGCTSGDTSIEEGQPKPVDTSTPNQGPEPTETPDPQVEIATAEIVTDDEGRNWIHAEIPNRSESPHGRLQVNYSVYDDSDDVVYTRDGLIDFIPSGELWRDYGMVLGERREDASYVESTIVSDPGSSPPSTVGDVSIVDSTLHKEFQSMTEIVGEVRNGGGQRSFYLSGLIYSESGDLRGSVGTYMSEVGADETRGFRAAIVGQWTPRTREADLPTQHEMYAFTNR